MKECAYCGGDVNDNETTCPHCSGTEFLNKCPVCGQGIEGTFCPHCAERSKAEEQAQAQAREQARAQAQAEYAEQAAAKEANMGLAWKVVLTLLIPFVGGYFLIKERVRPGFRIFGIVWCTIMGLTTATTPGYSVGINILSSLMCLAPIGYYLYKSRERLLRGGGAQGKAAYIGFVVVLIIALACSVATGS